MYRRKIQKKPVELTCRMCGEEEESLGHILSSCQEFLWSLYKQRHDRVLYQLVRGVAENLQLTLPDWLKVPSGVVRGGTSSEADVDRSMHPYGQAARAQKARLSSENQSRKEMGYI